MIVYDIAKWVHLLGKRRCQKPLINGQNIFLKMQQKHSDENRKCKRLAGDNNKEHISIEFTIQTTTHKTDLSYVCMRESF